MAFSKKSEKLVNNLIQAEYENACEKYGDKYNSLHEAYAVLLEEYEEMEHEIQHTNVLPQIWERIKMNDTQSLLEYVLQGEKNIVYAMKELAQVGAVFRKIKNTLPITTCTKACEYCVEQNGHYVCYGQKNAPRVNLGDECYYNK